MTDNEIVDLYLSRDESAITLTSVKYGKLLRSISFRITESIETSEECENDTYLEAWNRIPPHEPRTYLAAFLSKIIRNISLNRCIHDNRLKRKAHIDELTSEIEQCSPSDNSIEKDLDEQDLSDAINRFLHQQPKKKRILFLRRYFQLEKISSLAKELGYKENTLHSILFRMRQDLKDYLKKEGII